MSSSFDKRITNLTWWVFWRLLIISLLGPILGSLAGFIVGFILGTVGVSVDTIKIITGTIGGILGLSVAFFGLRYLVKRAVLKNVEGFRLDQAPPSS